MPSFSIAFCFNPDSFPCFSRYAMMRLRAKRVFLAALHATAEPLLAP